jgi:hypothetical protein
MSIFYQQVDLKISFSRISDIEDVNLKEQCLSSLLKRLSTHWDGNLNGTKFPESFDDFFKIY